MAVGSSRWANEEEDAAVVAQLKKEKEAKKRLRAEKAERARKLEKEAHQRRLQEEEEADKARAAAAAAAAAENSEDGVQERASKRRRISPASDKIEQNTTNPKRRLLRFPQSGWTNCRSITNFERLNHIEEGSYGTVSRQKDINTGEIVAVKHFRMDNSETQGFPVTALREIQCLMEARHKHIVDLREVVIGQSDADVYLIMDFEPHDLKTLQEEMQEPFAASEIKTLLLQLTDAVCHLHNLHILHRDIKTSNILMNNRGELKLADFGMARYYGDPPPQMTQLVVTLWYRAPELLLGADTYDGAIDLWSIGCVFGELLTKNPLLQGKNEVDQLSKVFELCGVPTEESWPGFKRLPNAKSLRLPRTQQNVGAVIRARFPFLTTTGATLLTSLLSLNPARRPTAKEILGDPYFEENPRPKSSAMFPTFPSKAGQEKRRRAASPSAPKRGDAPKIVGEAADFSGIFASREDEESGAGFQLKLV